MNTKQTKLSNAPKSSEANTGTPDPNPAAVPAPEILEALKALALTPEQVVALCFPELIEQPKAQAVYAGFFSGIGMDIGVSVPDWAKHASTLFWEAAGLECLGKSLANITPEEFGNIVGLFEMTKKELADYKIPPQFLQAVNTACQLAKAAINDDAPAEVAAKFHTGRAKAAKTADKARNLAKRTQIFLFIACGWQQVAALKGQVELWRWLTEKDEAGKQLVSDWDYADPMREMREVCQRIGLRFKKRPGKPPRSG